MINTLLVVLVCWMLICVWCGFGARIIWFGIALMLGMALNLIWVTLVLRVDPLSTHALMTYFSALLYALASFGLGWIVGRFVRSWQSSQIGD